ncbi:hypothetical protein [uncultured Psychrosphaera sp.]|uniref:hypothetical protein n=1 Tax=uncultured Psychrosphaera sp. TaxID=1403522 RepID=UPI0026270BFB|nr:hypothetical protein [uncultured Psychrosphaera sp.]
MINQREDMEDIDLSELFSGIDIKNISKPFDEYLSSLDSFFTKYDNGKSPRLIRFFEEFNPDSFINDELKFSAGALLIANYDESALRGECVVLFSEPVIISDIQCKNVPTNENEGAVRLISFKGMEKKFTTKRSTRSGHSIKSSLVSTYKVHDVVLGLILPRRCDFLSVKIAKYSSLLTDYKTLERTEKALQNASDLPLIAIENIERKFHNINVLINSRLEKYYTIQRDIQALEQEKSHTESSLDSSKIALDKARKDLDNTSREYEKLASRVVEERESLDVVQAKIKAEASFYKNEHLKLEGIQKESKVVSDSLQLIRQELNDANREKNLTTLDMVGHSNETSKQLKPYYFFAFITFVMLACMAKYIYTNGESFIEILPSLIQVSAWDILLSRLPLITASTLIIGGLSGVLFFLIKHIVSLNTEKMMMLKAAILAEQITNSLDCKNMTEQEQLEFKRDTKIKLITQVFSKNNSEKDKSNFIMDVLEAVNKKSK